MINACDHVFDCIEMGQGYHFHKGEVLWDASVYRLEQILFQKVTFTSRFYDTEHVALWRYYGENMNYTSVW